VHLEDNRIFNQDDLTLLNLFAPIAATAIDNARLFQAEKQKAEEQEALLKTMQDLSAKLNLNILLQSVVERSVELLKVTGGELAIYHPEDIQLEIVASHNLGMESMGLRMQLGEGAMGTAASEKRSLLIPDYQNWEGRSQKYQATQVHGVMVVPLLIKDQLVGALCSVHLDPERKFVEDDLRLLNLFAPLAATAIENARLFDKTHRLLEITEQREQELRRTQQQLVQQEKLASLGELTAGIAHEIQNPLNFVNNFSEVSVDLLQELAAEQSKDLAQQDKGLVEEILFDLRDNLTKINHHGKRADGIVKGMLQHSRSNSGSKEKTDINALCEEYLRLAYHGLRAKDNSFNAKLVTEFDPALGPVLINAQDMGRVILNLINNAFYAVEEKRNEAGPSHEPTVTITTVRQAQGWELRVKDNGKGIPVKLREKIFQPFFTTKPTGQGTGLGLSLSHDIVKAHGGALQLETCTQTELDLTTGGETGTSFIITLPIT
jgi:signal transduction histidine kinase